MYAGVRAEDADALHWAGRLARVEHEVHVEVARALLPAALENLNTR